MNAEPIAGEDNLESDGFFRALVELGDFTEDESFMAQWLVSQIRGGARMRQGLLVEAHLARLLGASLPTKGNTPWDLRLHDGRLAEVKSFSDRGPVDVKRNTKQADVWLFVKKGQHHDLDDARYFLVDTAELDAVCGGKKTMSVRRFEAAFGAGLDRDAFMRLFA